MENFNFAQSSASLDANASNENQASTIKDENSLVDGRNDLHEEEPKIVPLHVSCSQRPDWSCGPCRAYGVKKPWELV